MPIVFFYRLWNMLKLIGANIKVAFVMVKYAIQKLLKKGEPEGSE